MLDAASIRFLSNLVDFPSHIRGNMLDIALADGETKESVLNVEEIGNLGNSDHSIIKIELKVCPDFNFTKEKVHDWKKGDKEGLKAYLDTIDFLSDFQNKDTDESWSRFKEVIEVHSVKIAQKKR